MPVSLSPSSTRRDPYYDNAKFLIMWMVVVAHGMELLASKNDAANGLHKMITAFATPAFAFMSGAFSKSDFTKAEALKTVSGILIPYFAFQVLFSSLDHLYNGYPFVAYSIFNPYWGLWYVLALFVWRMLLPLIAATRFPMLLALAIGFAAGFVPPSASLVVNTRVFVFVPFFVAGHLVCSDLERLKRLTKLPVRIAALFCLMALTYAFIEYHDDLKWRWLLPRGNAASLNLTGEKWLLVRGAIYAVTLVLCACAFALVPKRRTFFTSLGAGTFFVYLLHIPLVRWASLTKLAGELRAHVSSDVLQVTVVFATAALLTLTLSQKPIRLLFKPLIEPNPKVVAVLAPLFVVLAIGLSFVPSLNYLGASVLPEKEIATTAKQSASRPPVEIGSSGVILKLKGKRTEKKVSTTITCAGTYTATLFDGRKKVGTKDVVVKKTDAPTKWNLPVRGKKKYNVLVLQPKTPEPCTAVSQLSTLRFSSR